MSFGSSIEDFGGLSTGCGCKASQATLLKTVNPFSQRGESRL